LVLAFTASSLVLAFVITAGLFGTMCLYGHLTRRDLAAWGSFLLMSLVGLILISVVNLLLGSATIDWILSLVGVAIFVGLSAHDAQNIRRLGASLNESGDVVQKAAIIGALDLYLDFLNLFLRLLALFGSRDD
jgi:FtsH-binding integral membrane protein